MAQEANPIRWARDLQPAAWLAGALDRSVLMGALVPAGHAAYARILHPLRRMPRARFPSSERRLLADLLRGETATPERCWFLVADRHRSLDTQGVPERFSFPDGGWRYLLHGGPLDHALWPPPEKKLQVKLLEQGSMREVLEDLGRQLEDQLDGMIGFSADVTRGELEEWLASGSRQLDELAPDLWWPEDRAWFVSASDRFALTFVGGSRRLVDGLLALPALEVVETPASESLGEIERLEDERTYGPVIATGSAADGPWTLRGRIDDDGAWSSLRTARGGGGSCGALPFQDLGWQKLGHFGGVGWLDGRRQFPGPGWSSLEGVVSKQAAAVEVHLADGTSFLARLIDTGDPRASFIVAFWSAACPWTSLVARDATGAELEVYRPPEHVST
jgi:hypothetical protein